MATLGVRFPHLKAYLSSAAHSDEALNFEQLLGFLYAVSSAPDAVGTAEWMRFVFVDGLPATEPGEDPGWIVAELFDLYHAIDRQVLERRVELPQECSPAPDPLANLDPDCGLSRWSQGFSIGHDWLEQAWDVRVSDDLGSELEWQLGGCMAVLCFFASRTVAEALHEEFRTDARSLEERANTVLALFPEALNAYAEIGRCLAAGGTRAEPSRGTLAWTGRYDSCPCGSGRKFSLCCGSSRHVH